MIESYNILMLLQFEGFYSQENALERECLAKMKDLDTKLHEINAYRERLHHEHTSLKEVVASKEKENMQ